MTLATAKTALIIGSTGLVGREIVRQLLASSEYCKVKSFVRRRSGQESWPGAEKLEEHVVDFSMVDSWKSLVRGNVLFSALGTTLKAAGSQEEQYKVDYQYQWDVARAARENEVETMVLISSTGASEKSPFFYLRTKGELDKDIDILGFKKLRILRPASLKGKRTPPRRAEEISVWAIESVLRVLKPVISESTGNKFRPIPCENVARAAIQSARLDHQGRMIFEAGDVWHLAENVASTAQ